MNSQRPVPAIRPPNFLKRWQVRVAAISLLVVPFFVAIPLTLRRHPIISPLGDQLHVVLLAGVTLMLYWRGPFTGRLWPAVMAAAVAGAAIEIIQIPFGRSADIMDFVLDLVGIGFVVGYVFWRGYGKRVGLGLIIALLLTFPARLYHVPFVASAAYHARQSFPTITDLEGPRDHWLWDGNHAVVTVLEIPDSPQGPGRVLRLTGGPPNAWPSAEMRRFPHDWLGHKELVFDARLVASEPDSHKFALRADDYIGRKEKTWISSHYIATNEWQSFSFEIGDRLVTDITDQSGRLFDFGDIDRILFYLPRPTSKVTLEIDNLRLQ
ncbi:MAG: hypothetical protein ACI9UQ_001797 [Candidatus Krumholzibacteriia bacterium]|jgi:hypothetical protein